MAATIHEVAKRAGVSAATVSYVLNNRPGAVRISDRTKERIWNAVRELGYHPNALASGLAGKRTHTVALVMQYASIFSGWSGFTSAMMHGVIEAANAHDLDLLLHTRERADVRAEALALADGRVDGALLLRDWDDPLIDLLADKGIPTVLIFSRSRNATVPYACCDDELGGRLAAEHLIGLGHRRILHVTGSTHSSAALDRLRGFEDALRNADIEPDPTLVVEMPHGAERSDVIGAALRRKPGVTAVFAWSDDAALRVIAEAREMGIRVPEDLSVMGFDSTEVCDHVTPPLTSVAQNIPAIAREGVRMLSALIQGADGEIRSTVVPPELHIRGSVVPAP
jgi:LacI family transcriptional regulator